MPCALYGLDYVYAPPQTVQDVALLTLVDYARTEDLAVDGRRMKWQGFRWLYATPGSHVISGVFDGQPASIRFDVPADNGEIYLTLEGQPPALYGSVRINPRSE